MKNDRAVIVVFLFFLASCPFSSAQVVFVDTPGRPLPVEQRLKDACLLYGLRVAQVSVPNNHARMAIRTTLELKGGRTLIITGRALNTVGVNDVQEIVAESSQKKISVLIVGITPDTGMETLRRWFGDSFIRHAGTTSNPAKGFYSISAAKEISYELSGLEFPVAFEEIDYLILDEALPAQDIICVRDKGQEVSLPIFAKTVVDEQNVFLLTQLRLSRPSGKLTGRFNIEYFLEIAPLMMFLRYSCGQLCWHSPGHYANLTIDDPWLTEPYGYLSYRGLLQQMDKANFHVTIAFVPWNYDRNETAVVSLFKERPDRFSICFHGNDHDHYEFYKYKTNATDSWPAVPLDTQEINVRQAIGRMEQLKNITGLIFDRIMVFPHGIAPAETLWLLKKYNFLATSNSRNVPLGSNEPNDPVYSLRPVTLAFHNFMSLDRDPVDTKTELDIAANLFLGNPLLFYSHHDLFRHGIDTFNKTADLVNEVEPDTDWCSLEYIARQMYLERMRADGGHDIRSFSRSIEISNEQKREVVYHVRKEESFSPPIRLVTVDGKPHPYERSGSDIFLTIIVPGGESSTVDITYDNALDLTSIDLTKSDHHVRRLRRLSDFRDITMSRSLPGRMVTRIYYGFGLYKLGLRRLAIICITLAVTICLGARRALKHIKRLGPKSVEIQDTN